MRCSDFWDCIKNARQWSGPSESFALLRMTGFRQGFDCCLQPLLGWCRLLCKEVVEGLNGSKFVSPHIKNGV